MSTQITSSAVHASNYKDIYTRSAILKREEVHHNKRNPVKHTHVVSFIISLVC